MSYRSCCCCDHGSVVTEDTAAKCTELVASPVDEPVSKELAYQQLRITPDETCEGVNTEIHEIDPWLEAIIPASREYVEDYTSQCYGKSQYRMILTEWADTISFAYSPVFSVDSISYKDVGNVDMTVPGTIYTVESCTKHIKLVTGQAWPDIFPGSEIVITFTVGTDMVPKSVIAAILLMIGHFDRNRAAVGDPVKEVPLGVRALLDGHRKTMGFA